MAKRRKLILWLGLAILHLIAQPGHAQPSLAFQTWFQPLGGTYTVDAQERIIAVRLDKPSRKRLHEDPVNDAELEPLLELKHVQILSLRDRPSITDVGVGTLAKLSTLEQLNLDGTSVAGPGLSRLRDLPQLRTLSLNKCPKLSNRSALWISRLSQLNSLSIQGSPNLWMSDEGWLNALDVARQSPNSPDSMASELRSGVGDPGMKHILRMTNLKRLTIPFTPVTHQGLANLKNLTNLEILDLNRTLLKNDVVTPISKLRKLKSLGLEFTLVNNSGLKQLEQLQQLEELYLSGTSITGEAIASIAKLKNLRRLTLRHCKMTDAQLKRLHNLKNLELIDLQGTGASLSALLEFAKLPAVELPSLLQTNGIAIRDTDGRFMSLVFKGWRVRDGDLQLLKQFPEVDLIDLSYSNVSGAGLRYVAQLSRLETLKLTGTNIDDRALTHMHSMKKVRNIELSETPTSLQARIALHRSLGRSEAEILDKVFRLSNVSREADLRRLRATDADLNWLNKAANLSRLSLDNSGNITSKGIAQLCTMSKLSQLTLRGIHASTDDVERLSRLPKLESLWLIGSNLPSSSFRSLVNCDSLTVLNLCGNQLNDEIVDTVSQLEKLKRFIFDSGQITPEGLARLKRIRPKLAIYPSQWKALADIRGRKRQEDWLPQGYKRAQVMHNVKTEVSGPDEIIQIRGDEFFEQAKTFDYSPKNTASKLERLESLSTLSQANIINVKQPTSAMKAVAKTQVTNVSLFGSAVSPDDLALLATMPNLQILDLRRTNVTDTAIDVLSRLKELKQLKLGDSQLSERGVKTLRAALPETEISTAR